MSNAPPPADDAKDMIATEIVTTKAPLQFRILLTHAPR